MTRWEYKTVKLKVNGLGTVFGSGVNEAELDGHLKLMGLDGWELVTAVASGTLGGTRCLLYTFKRPLS